MVLIWVLVVGDVIVGVIRVSFVLFRDLMVLRVGVSFVEKVF